MKKHMEKNILNWNKLMKNIDYQKKKKKEHKNNIVALSSINQEIAKIVDKNKDLFIAFDGESFYIGAMIDKETYYPRFETGYQFNPDKGKEFTQQFHDRSFTQFNDQVYAILRVRY